jgi:single-stranded DNA-specific DHH superfamily exonuclease
MEKILKKFKDWFLDLGDERVAVMCHWDADGLSSGIIALKAVQRLQGNENKFVFMQKEREPTAELIEYLDENKIDRLIVTDIALGNDVEKLQKVLSRVKVLIIDHHLTDDAELEGITYINSRDVESWVEEPARYPASKLCFDCFNSLVDINDLDWLAAYGIVGDFAIDYWREFYEGTIAKYKFTNEEFKLGNHYIGSASPLGFERIYEAFWMLYEMNGPSEVIEKMTESYNLVQTELDAIDASFSDEVNKMGRLYVYEINTQYELVSVAATMLSVNRIDPSETLVTINVGAGGDECSVSARCQSMDIPVNELLKGATKDIGARAGGHKVAAGGTIKTKDLERFKKNLIRVYTELESK